MINYTKVLSSAGNIADDLIESPEERQTALTDRHKHDMSSDNILSKSIRPLSLLILLLAFCFTIVADAYGMETATDTKLMITSLLMAAFGFYFNSRKVEKVAADNAKANIAIKKLEASTKSKETRKEARHKRKLERRAVKIGHTTQDGAEEETETFEETQID